MRTMRTSERLPYTYIRRINGNNIICAPKTSVWRVFHLSKL
jgi:hypothetical protein